MKENPHIGSSLDSFLREEGILEEATEHAVKAADAWRTTLNEAMDEQIALLKSEPLERGLFVNVNPFTRNRIVEIWSMIKEAKGAA